MNKNQIEAEFDREFVQFDKFGVAVGGFERAPYKNIKQHLFQTITAVVEELVEGEVDLEIDVENTHINSVYSEGYNQKRQEILQKLEEMGLNN